MEAIFDVRNVSKALGEGAARQTIIGDLSFAAHPGEFLSIVGPSGRGKTTPLMCLAGLYGVDAGSVRFEQQAVKAPPSTGRCR